MAPRPTRGRRGSQNQNGETAESSMNDAARNVAAVEAEARRVTAEAEARRIAAEQEAQRIVAENAAHNQANANLGLQAVLTMLAQVLQRLPVANPAGGGGPIGNGNDGENGRANENEHDVEEEDPPARIPSYLTMLDRMLKMGTKFFPGGSKPVEADEWRGRLERNFESIRCPEQYKKDIAVHFLEEDAHIWWKGASSRLPSPDCSWDTFRELFRNKYFPPEAFDRLESAFLDLHQGSKTVREYETEFNQLKRYAGRELEDEHVQVRRFMRGLRVELRNGCLVRNYATVAELVEKAAMLEEGIAEERKLMGGATQVKSSHGQSGKGGQNKPKWDRNSGSNKSARSACSTCGKMHAGVCRAGTGACLRCGSMDHHVRDCPQADKRVCFACNQSGHLKKDCPMQMVQAAGNLKRPSNGPQPPAKRQNIEPRVYNMVVHEETSGEAARPITGKSCQLTS